MSVEDDATAAPTSRPTLKTIAYMTGLGVTTVSRALKDAPDIGKDTKERVRLVAKQIGYRPNRAGVRLRTGKTNVISLILNVEHEVLGLSSQLIHGISGVLADTPYHLIVTPYARGGDPMVPVRYIVETGSADGLIMSRLEPRDPRVSYLSDCGFPFATHGRTELDIAHPYCDFDNETFARVAVEKLVQRGRRKLSLLSPPPFLTYAGHMAEGFLTGVEAHDLIDVPLRRITTDDTVAEIAEEIERVMRGSNPPEGIVCGSAHSAIGATSGIEQAGFRLGRDIDLVVKESFDMMSRFRPEIMVVKEDFLLAGAKLAEAVVKSIAGTPSAELQFIERPTL